VPIGSGAIERKYADRFTIDMFPSRSGVASRMNDHSTLFAHRLLRSSKSPSSVPLAFSESAVPSHFRARHVRSDERTQRRNQPNPPQHENNSDESFAGRGWRDFAIAHRRGGHQCPPIELLKSPLTVSGSMSVNSEPPATDENTRDDNRDELVSGDRRL
jgi:hypothetical protein